MLVKLLIISAVIIAAAFIFLGVRILISENGRFPETHVGHNREMRKRGIRCAQNTDTGCTPERYSEECPACGEKSND